MTQQPAQAPDSAETWNSRGLGHYRQGALQEAGNCFSRAIKMDPLQSAFHANLANVLRDMRRFPLAEKGYRHALKLDQRNTAAWSDFGRLCFMMRREDEALDCLKRAVDCDPANEAAQVRLLDVLERTNRLEEARAALDAVKARLAASPGIALQEAKLLRREGKAQEAAALLEEHANWVRAKLPPDHPFAVEYFFECGMAQDRAGNADKAFAAFTAANKGQAAGPAAKAVSPAICHTAVARLKRGFTLPGGEEEEAGDGMPDPVFLVGFPRSGTTLLEQVLAGHPAVAAAEEVPAVDNMAVALEKRRGRQPTGWWTDDAYPACLSGTSAEDVAEMRRAFFSTHGAEAGSGKTLLLDKLPLNLLHAGLIHRVFPRSKFILLLRHPCDAVLSCFMQRFELNPAMSRFLDLQDAARFYAECFDIWDASAKQLGLDVHTLRYEDMVEDLKGEAEKLLSFLGLPWDDAVLDHGARAKNKEERIRTPSYHQVTEKIYTRSRGRWLNYRRHMEPVLGILKPHAEKYGYDMDGGEGRA